MKEFPSSGFSTSQKNEFFSGFLEMATQIFDLFWQIYNVILLSEKNNFPYNKHSEQNFQETENENTMKFSVPETKWVSLVK